MIEKSLGIAILQKSEKHVHNVEKIFESKLRKKKLPMDFLVRVVVEDFLRFRYAYLKGLEKISSWKAPLQSNMLVDAFGEGVQRIL